MNINLYRINGTHLKLQTFSCSNKRVFPSFWAPPSAHCFVFLIPLMSQVTTAGNIARGYKLSSNFHQNQYHQTYGSITAAFRNNSLRLPSFFYTIAVKQLIPFSLGAWLQLDLQDNLNYKTPFFCNVFLIV